MSIGIGFQDTNGGRGYMAVDELKGLLNLQLSNVSGIATGASYTITQSGNNFLAVNGISGTTDFKGTDPVTVINSAIGNLPNGGLVYVNVDNTMTITNSPILMKSNTYLRGNGWSTIFKLGNGANINVISQANLSVSISNINISDLKIDGNIENNATGNGIDLFAVLGNIHHVDISGVPVDGIHLEPGSQLHVHDNQIHGRNPTTLIAAGSGIVLNGDSQALGNLIFYFNTSGIELTRGTNVVNNNRMFQNFVGINVKSLGNVVNGNLVSSNQQYGIGLLASSTVKTSAAHNVVVGNKIWGASLAGAGLFDGIFIQGVSSSYVASYNIITSNRIARVSGVPGIPNVNMRFGINESTFANFNVIMNNHITDIAPVSALVWSTQTTGPEDNNWLSVTYSTTLKLLVAVSGTGTGNRVMTSPDGSIWTTQVSAADNFWTGVCWSSELGLFCAVANSGTQATKVMTSPDGIIWTSHSAANPNAWEAVAWSPELGLFCAVAGNGTGNRVMTSPDGSVWTTRVSAADNFWTSICWSPQLLLFVAVANSGTGNRIMTSPDGIVWTTRTNPVDNDWMSVCWSPDLLIFCAVSSTGTGNRVMTSPDGIVWTTQASAADRFWDSVCWSTDLNTFVAVSTTGTNDRIMTSPDGLVWTSQASSANNSWTSVVWAPDLSEFVAVAASGVQNRVMTGVLSTTNNKGIHASGTSTKVKYNIGNVTENDVLSTTFPIDSVAKVAVTIPHGLAITPAVQDCYISVTTTITDWIGQIIVISTDATNVHVTVNVTTASLTVGATARLSLRSGNA